VVQFGVALLTEREKVQFGVISGMAAEILVVNLQVRHRSAKLTSPSVSAQHLLA